MNDAMANDGMASNTQDPQTPSPIAISADDLSDQALEGIIESFILREGTDYGRNEASFTSKSDQIRRQIESGKIKIVFDPASETINLITDREFQTAVNQRAFKDHPCD